jgi:hypothetical protein
MQNAPSRLINHVRRESTCALQLNGRFTSVIDPTCGWVAFYVFQTYVGYTCSSSPASFPGADRMSGSPPVGGFHVLSPETALRAGHSPHMVSISVQRPTRSHDLDHSHLHKKSRTFTQSSSLAIQPVLQTPLGS